MPATRVLLVEDTEDDMMLVRAHLRSDGRFQLQHVDTLQSACDTLRNGEASEVVILDLNLPDSSGLATFKRLNDLFPHIPIVILSGQDDEEVAIEAVGSGAQDYVPKSAIDAQILVRMLLYAIERNGRQLAEQRNLTIEGDLSAARQIQQHLLPTDSPRIDGFDIAGLCQPASVTAGDFFDYIDLKNAHWDLLVADVSGHGFAPAMTMVGTRRLLRTCAPMNNNVGELLTLVNNAVVEDTLPWQFVTLFYARLNPESRELFYSGAGHAGTVIRKDGTVMHLGSSGLPLGLATDTVYSTKEAVRLAVGDVLLLMTDGAHEAQSPEGELFGRDRIIEIAKQHTAKSSEGVLQELLAAIEQFICPGTVQDDITFVIVKVTG